MEAIIKSPHQHWVHTWAAMPQQADPSELPQYPFTLRQTVRVTLGTASHIRLRLSNAFGHEPLTIAEVTIAQSAGNVSGTNEIQPGTMCHVTFCGDRGAQIPAGAQIVSDPVDIGPLPPSTALSISLFLPNEPSLEAVTTHPGSRTTSWFTAGNKISELSFSGRDVGQVDHWYYISGIEAFLPRESGAFALIGDSITDGRCSTTNGDTRWPDFLLSRLRNSSSKAPLAIVNQAAGANCVLVDGSGGPSVLARLDRDILSLSGVRYAMIFEGINDIGITLPDPDSLAILEKQLIAGYVQVATRLASAGIVVFIATLTPFGPRNGEEDNQDTTPYSHPLREETRQRVNAWIRNSCPAVFDSVIDFDAVVRDEKEYSALAKQYDSGDHLHPNEAAFQALANSFPLDIFDI
ncbi:extracellular GDSL-like lipase/acylhydrolase, putative [Talaromyces stipitatus ATCC 10500]|uniref:Extracellular GDSL-like lipase/acylhydrolase, putative n=1 Tax=Talaromyces stipitatus (strain ATCC 10500 / CBS 375.48 / QM 6759 / NRRL 1006) TaxID=441959 RepID=B8MQG2_TALSN|nr:extracellular GDSL-like lipase/acylhydrolase, putative [Talaromyces stipitatus ATCC 10500]EED13364.1 extracellular GDSL-like lipase/acylhydrolase, putative [Talaromyces stipitatus ATCC 10500]